MKKFKWMKIILISKTPRMSFTWVFILLMVFNACKEKDTVTVLSGELPDLPNKTIELIPVDSYFPGLNGNKGLMVTQTDSIGRFKFKSHEIESGFFQVINENYHRLRYDIYLEKGDSIFIEQSSWNDSPELRISGNGAEKLSYLARDFKIFPPDKSFYNTLRSDKFKTELAFKSYVDSIQADRINAVNTNKSIPQNLKRHFLNVIYAETATILLEHLERRNYYMHSNFDYYFPDSTYLSFMNELKFDNFFCNNTKVKLLAKPYLNCKARFSFKDKDEKTWWNNNLSWKLDYLSNQPKSTWTDLMALSTISEYSFGLHLDDFLKNLNDFEKKVDQIFYNDFYRQLFRNNSSDYFCLAPGKPAPDFALPDFKGDIVRLSDFQGKVVYIDFWGTWCSPCVEEIPDALKLQEKYKGKPVVFLYVALEYDEENITYWKEFISGENIRSRKYLESKPFGGIHIVAEKQFGNETIKPYKINFAPTHVLVDPNGYIVNARANGPANIAEHIDKLLYSMD